MGHCPTLDRGVDSGMADHKRINRSAARIDVSRASADRGKPVGAVIAAAGIMRALHDADRPLGASEIARLTGLHRGTAYNILRTLEAEGLVSYDDKARAYALSFHLLELAHGVLRKSGLMEVSRPLMHAITDRHNVTVYLSKVVGPSSTLLLDWVGAGFQTDVYLTVGRQYFPLVGAPGVVIAAFSEESRKTLLAEFGKISWNRKPSEEELAARITAMREDGLAIDRENLFRGLVQVSVPILSSGGSLAMIMTSAGQTRALNPSKVDDLGRDMIVSARRISDALRIVRLD